MESAGKEMHAKTQTQIKQQNKRAHLQLQVCRERTELSPHRDLQDKGPETKGTVGGRGGRSWMAEVPRQEHREGAQPHSEGRHPWPSLKHLVELLKHTMAGFAELWNH